MLRLLNFRCSFCSNPLDETHTGTVTYDEPVDLGVYDGFMVVA